MVPDKAEEEKIVQGNVENKWPTFQDGICKAAFSPFCRAHVQGVRSARQKGCGLAGRTFLNIPVGR